MGTQILRLFQISIYFQNCFLSYFKTRSNLFTRLHKNIYKEVVIHLDIFLERVF